MSVLLHLLVGSDNPAKTHRSLCQPDPVALVAIRGLGASHSPEKFLLLVASRKAWGGARRSHPNTSAGAWWHRRRGWWLRWRCTTRRVRQRARPGSQAMRSAGAACPTTLGTTSICSLGCSWISRQPALPRRHKARPARAANTASKGASRALGGRWAARLRGHAAASNATATSDATAAPCLEARGCRRRLRQETHVGSANWREQPLHVPPLSSPEKRRVPQSGRLLGALERKVRQPRCGNSVHNSADEAGLLRGVVGHGPGIGRAQRLEDLNENKQAHDVQARQQRHQCAPDLLSVPGVAGAMKLQYALQDGTGASTEQQRAESWVSSD
mmetsp:Transcript_114319/g.369628  ORF Transcript_114319/g.369628 Transcript_114319/m.369628 type:complete len:329 (+) Transcript_114319:283-1269(+)